MPKAFLLTNKRYDLYKLNIPKIWRDNKSDDEEERSKISKSPEVRSGQSWGSLNTKSAEDEREWTLIIDEEEPVNLSLKKLDLFNLTQLAEVSLARGHQEENCQKSPAESSISFVSTPLQVENENENENTEFKTYSSKILNSKRIVRNIVTSTNNSVPSLSSVRHVCVECGRGFSTLSNLARHRQTHRSPTDSSAVKKCPSCDKVYVSMPAYSMHLRTHNQGCKCPYCGKGFSRPWLLQGHIRTHTGEKPFKCNICAKAFADKSNLRAHVQTHSTEKPFTCSRCQKTFALKSYLCKHIESSCMRSNRSGYTSSGSSGSSGKNHSDNECPNESSTN